MSAIYRLSLNGAILTPHTMALVLTTVMSTLH
jgi:NAD kinase